MTQPFVILSTQRSGSTFIRIWLNAHSQINSHGEIWLKHYRSADGFYRFCSQRADYAIRFSLHHARLLRKLNLNCISRTMIQTYLKSLLNDPGHSLPWTDIEDRDRFQPKTTKADSGFKIMYSTIEMYPGLRSWIHEACPSIIHVIRRNFLKQHISQLRMRRDKLDHTNKTDVGYRPVRIDLDQFMYLLRLRDTIESKYREIYSTSGRYFELYYEDFFSSFEKSKQRLLAFLGLENEGMPLPDIKKISSNDIRKEIENWREVIDHLMNSEYDYLLNAFSDNGRVLV